MPIDAFGNPTLVAAGEDVDHVGENARSLRIVRTYPTVADRDQDLTAPHDGTVVYVASVGPQIREGGVWKDLRVADDPILWTAIQGVPATFPPASHPYSAHSGSVPLAAIPTGTSGSTVALGNHGHAYLPVSNPSATGTLEVNRGALDIGLRLTTPTATNEETSGMIFASDVSTRGPVLRGFRYGSSQAHGFRIYTYSSGLIPALFFDNLGNAEFHSDIVSVPIPTLPGQIGDFVAYWDDDRSPGVSSHWQLGTTATSGSSRDVKKQIADHDYADVGERFLRSRRVTWKYAKTKLEERGLPYPGDRTFTGWIAEELEEESPELVKRYDDGTLRIRDGRPLQDALIDTIHYLADRVSALETALAQKGLSEAT